MPSAADDLRSAIRAAGGRIGFDEFMRTVLYGPHGFYTSGGSAGRRGDFITSPEVGPLFGAVLARMLDAEWERCGRPDGFTVVDAGAGPGTLARAVLAASPACLANGRYVAVETSAAQRGKHPEGVESVATMPGDVGAGVIVANELLDNMPFELWVHDGSWRRAVVTERGEGFAEELVAGEPGFPLRSGAPHGARVSVQHDAAAWLAAALASLSVGSVVVIDYCTATTVQAAAVPWREWLRTYAGHEKGGHYLRNPGGQDITTQVMVDQLVAVRRPDAVRTQAQFLQLWGIDALVEEGRAYWREHAASPTLAAVRMRSRVAEAEALLDPTGLGAFNVLEWRV
ncbi:MAG: SAM-dependent methyltransferase [Acidimicrobiales bacterium]